MAIRTAEEIEDRIKQLDKQEADFTQFLRDTYGDKQCGHKIEQHIWRIRREREILQWVLNESLPF